MSLVYLAYAPQGKIDIDYHADQSQKNDQIYQWDRVDECHNDKVYGKCHRLCVTKESENEANPMEKEGIVIVADIILDNRKSLIERLDSVSDGEEISDIELIYHGYQKWGEKLPENLIGDFSVIICDNYKEIVIAFRDHVGKRPLYYRQSDDGIVFASTMKVLTDGSSTYNEEWIANYLALPGVTQEAEVVPTIYEDIYEVEPAQCIVFHDQTIRKTKYWDPRVSKGKKYRTRRSWERAYEETFAEAVRCRLRTSHGVGIMLSSGLDSTAVADMMDRYIDKGDSVNGYTTVPLYDALEALPKDIVSDESDLVKTFVANYPWLKANWIRSEGKDSVTDIERFLEVYEHPYKLTNNAYWVDETYRRASEDGVRVLLNGQFGNSTISYGNAIDQFRRLYESKRYISFYRSLRAHCKLKQVSFRNSLYEVVSTIFNMRHVAETIDEDTLLNKKLQRRYKTVDKLNASGLMAMTYLGHREYVDVILASALWTQIGNMESKLGHHHGLINRDPTMDKRVIELCFNLPDRAFFHKGYDRYLVRKVMSDKVPEEIRYNMKLKGMQSSDWIERLKKLHPDLIDEVKELLEDDLIHYYFDIKHLRRIINNNGMEAMTFKNQNDLKALLQVVIYNRYYKHLN